MAVAGIMNSKANELKLADFFILTEYKLTPEQIKMLREPQEEPSDPSQIELTPQEKMSQSIWRTHIASAKRVFEKQKRQKVK